MPLKFVERGLLKKSGQFARVCNLLLVLTLLGVVIVHVSISLPISQTRLLSMMAQQG